MWLCGLFAVSRQETDRRPFATVSLADQRVWNSALRLAGLEAEGYRFHDLRHTCVSGLVAAGADVKLVQAVAGHANPLITLKRYSHLLDARVTEAAQHFDPARVP
jgi:integrase